MVYMGLSLFIIRRALRVSGCMHTYVYNLTLAAGLFLFQLSYCTLFNGSQGKCKFPILFKRVDCALTKIHGATAWAKLVQDGFAFANYLGH